MLSKQVKQLKRTCVIIDITIMKVKIIIDVVLRTILIKNKITCF